MPGNDAYFEEPDDHFPDDDLLDDDLSDDDPSDDQPSETVPCPRCGAEIYEDVERCPYCEAYITHDHRPWTGRPAWWIVLGLAGFVAAMLALLRCTPP